MPGTMLGVRNDAVTAANRGTKGEPPEQDPSAEETQSEQEPSWPEGRGTTFQARAVIKSKPQR